jgi:hypothetical protein
MVKIYQDAFYCEKCGAIVRKDKEGNIITGCEHYKIPKNDELKDLMEIFGISEKKG